MDKAKAIAVLLEMFLFYGKQVESTSIILRAWVKRLSGHISTNQELEDLIENIVANNRFLPTVEEALDYFYFDPEICTKQWLKLSEYCNTQRVLGVAEQDRKKLNPTLESVMAAMGGAHKLGLMDKFSFLQLEKEFDNIYKQHCKRAKINITQQRLDHDNNNKIPELKPVEIQVFSQSGENNSITNQLRKDYQNLSKAFNSPFYNPLDEEGNLKQGEQWMTTEQREAISEQLKILNDKLRG